MNFKKSLRSKENGKKVMKGKTVFFSFVLFLFALFFVVNGDKVSAAEPTVVINSTNYKQTGEEEAKDYAVKTLTSGEYSLTFIQGSGLNNNVAIKFTIENFPSTIDSFIVAESEHSDSDDGDLDRYTKKGNTWAGSFPAETYGITGSATEIVRENDQVDMEVVYRIRKGAYGLQFLKLFLYDYDLEDLPEGEDGVIPIEVFYVISRPVNTLPDSIISSESCSSESGLEENICIEYDLDGTPQREPRPLKVHIPSTIAYKFAVANENSATSDYLDKTKSTIYAINYFKEENGNLYTVEDKDDANRSYLYVNFTKNGSDTTETYAALATAPGGYMNYRVGTTNQYSINKIANLAMEIDAKGTYFFYLVDIFGNVKEVSQAISNVVNRTLYTEITKGNAKDPDNNKGYDAEENFTNKSVAVSLTMTVETKFEFGQCLNNMCATITNLTSDQVSFIKYWRVDVEIDEHGDDIDAFENVTIDPITEEYASEEYAYNNEFFYIYCLNNSCPSGADVQKWSDEEADQTSPTNAGYAGFSGNTITMYLALNGRYRFYIRDIQGNNTWGADGDLAAQEDRNPRVEIYGIDKEAPEITFEHDDVKEVGGKDLTLFDIETYEFYRGIELLAGEDGKFVYDGRMTGNPAAGSITTGIYYPINRDDGRTGDDLFDDLQAIIRSHVRAAEYVYYYTGNTLKEKFSDYSVYDRLEDGVYREDGVYYITQGYDNSRIATIAKNTKHTSTGLLDEDNEFEFEIRYYHNDGSTRICAYLGSIEGYTSYASKTELQCVNYYLDHGVDFIIEFGATDTVGNTRYEKVYVNVVDTTPPGFTYQQDADGNADATKMIKSSNIGTECRMEMGSVIGVSNAKQNKTKILNCYNVIVNGEYIFEDNVYDTATDAGLSFSNRINSNSYVKVYIKSDVDDNWIDLETNEFIPNRTGYYDMKIEIHDNTISAEGTNVLTVLVSYYVDKKIVLVQAKEENKFYGESDPMLDYCVWINQTNDYELGYFDNPYNYLAHFSIVYCTNNTPEEITDGKKLLFRENVDSSDFAGALTRLESSWYNENLSTALGAPTNVKNLDEEDKGIENNYVGLYRIILGTLNINITEENTQDPDYVVKIHPEYRDATKYNGETNDNLVSHNMFEDDLAYTQSDVDFTIKQVILRVNANGGEKYYSSADTNSIKYDSDGEQTNPYLNGYTVNISDLKYNDDASIVLGVLRREIGENVGVYYICNYRGLDTADNALEAINGMYLNCADSQNSEMKIVGADAHGDGGEYKQTNGIIYANPNYIKSRALYIKTNKQTDGKTLNVTTKTRDNNFANYVIEYTGSVYSINPIDLVVQAAPGQRREYNKSGIEDPNPWEIILYGLEDFARAEDDTFNGYTVTSDEYSQADNQKDRDDLPETHVSKLEANQSEERDEWKLVHNNKTLKGLKTNETYTLLRATAENSVAGSAKLKRVTGQTGGWYLYHSLANDIYVGASEARSNVSDIAVITNGNRDCTYDTNGHTITSVGTDGESLCKNYNLIYNAYYTDEDGYTYQTQLENHDDEDFIYKSNGELCTELDPGLPCVNTEDDEEKIYKIHFEIYRREIIMEFNSALERVLLEGTEVNGDYYDIVYGKRYNYYASNLFDIAFYNGKEHDGVKILPEDYLFICYKNETTRSEFTAGDDKTGCTGDPNYGLTQGDTWSNIELKFWMHSVVSTGYSGANATDKAIPAGVYYIYADIDIDEKVNYNFIYKGGALTIKSKSVDIQITSYQKEYGEAYYSSYGIGTDYASFEQYSKKCINDALILANGEDLIGVTCGDHDTSNSYKNVYGFYIIGDGLDDLDSITGNFEGNPNRLRSTSLITDINALQDDVGIYTITKGTIKTANTNPFKSSHACATIGDITDEDNLCAVVVDKEINNYVIDGEVRSYVFDMQLINDITSTNAIVGNPKIEQGKLFITPATLTITVTENQTKMYGCAYNSFNNNSSAYGYSYEDGYSNCEESDGTGYDLGYSYVVNGDKDYTIANSDDGYSYTGLLSYNVSGINDGSSNTFRPTVKKTGIKSHALNDYGTLYRVSTSDYNAESPALTKDVLSSLAASTQLAPGVTGKTYQGQTVGEYIITLGNLDAALNGAHVNMANSCDANNMPVANGSYACKNYHINYYGESANPNNEDKVNYLKNDELPEEIKFSITARKTYVYTNHDEKIYQDPDPDVKYKCGDYNMDGKVDESDNVGKINGDVYYRFCSEAQVTNEAVYEYGLTRYYTKTNSLAKYPWNGNTENRDDTQYDIMSGKLSRKGMPSGENAWSNPQKNDIRGLYEYAYNNYGGSVTLNEYGASNYTVNFYNESGLAVNINGEVQNDDGEQDLIQFEIVFRQIQIAFVTFDKVYGEADNVEDYNILVCAPTDTFDFVNMKCIVNDQNDPHGLGADHKGTYMADGVLNQSEFKKDFIVKFKRVLGENVSCENSTSIEVVLNGYFFGEATEVTLEGTRYEKTLSCADTHDNDELGYQTLAYIDQSSSDVYGYNYQVKYTIGQVNIVPRKIVITPDPDQGFMYGDYYGTLIPAITFKNSLDTSNVNTRATYGLVNNVSNAEGVCLQNIDYYNSETNTGTCFNINDRQDEYNSGNSMTTSAYNSSSVNADTGLANLNIKNFVFGDVYDSESSTRSALNRKLSTSTNERYNRNVGTYIITLGDLADKTGNYVIKLSGDVEYKITNASLTITPDSTVYEGTTQNTQYKIYGEQDKELTFSVKTIYKVTHSHFALYDSAIVKVCPEGATSPSECTKNANLERYEYDTDTKKFVPIDGGTYILLVKSYTVEINGFAYNETDPDKAANNLDYGASKKGEKKVEFEAINQAAITDSKYYDIVCNNIVNGVGCTYLDPDTDEQIEPTLSYGETDRILLGYLYVTGYAQSAGVYNIASGFKVALNEWNAYNYSINFVDDVKFTIIPRPIGVQIQNIVKTYGQSTDIISCEAADVCSVEDGILASGSEGYLKYNFNVELFNDSTRIADILGNNSILYSQNSTFVNGLVSNASYSQYKAAETKNSNQLGVYVSRDERNTSNGECLYDSDKYGLCEDVGVYSLRFYGYKNTIDNLTTDDYDAKFKPTVVGYDGAKATVNTYYYNSYWGYNPNYFVIVVDSDTVADTETDEAAIKNVFVNSADTTSRSVAEGSTEKLLKPTGTLTINRKSVAMYVNTTYFGANAEIYYIQQNTQPPRLPTINNAKDLDYEKFMNGSKKDAVYDYETYGNVIWGSSPKQVRTGDKLVGALAYCDVIISANAYYSLRDDGINSDYTCANLLYEANKHNLNTELEGYVPIVRSTSALSIVSESDESARAAYENRNYVVKFYPGGLRIEKDDVKPVVQVNRPDVYIEANAVGEYLYECVGTNNSTTYTDCNLGGTNISIVGKTELINTDPILNILNELGTDNIIQVKLPTIEECSAATGHACTASAYYQLLFGKGQDGYVDAGGIKAGIESSLVAPFTMEKAGYIKNAGPTNLKELIITLVNWFGVTAYDAGEIKNGELLEKHFDKYWYIAIEEEGTNGSFEINKVGKYKVHFYVMDNAGNVSEGNMYLDEDSKPTGTITDNAQTDYSNVGILHIIDTTKPIVGTLNLYSGKVMCNARTTDCSIEANWQVAEDTYAPLNTLGRYDSTGKPSAEGEYIYLGANINSLTKIDNSLDRYTLSGGAYVKDNAQGKYILIEKGMNARALKHYSWTNSKNGVYLTITGGSDNSYTEKIFGGESIDSSQWNHYFSRDGGTTWFLYERDNKNGDGYVFSYLALDSEGSREILIKAVDSGVHILGTTEANSKYYTNYYGSGNANNREASMIKYVFNDTSVHDDWLNEYEKQTVEKTEEEKLADEAIRHEKVGLVGWNISDSAEEDETMTETIALLLYGTTDAVNGVTYKYYRDKQTAYLDRTKPVISFGEYNGKDIYLYEYGCGLDSCKNGYTEYYAGAIDEYPTQVVSKEIPASDYNKNNSIFINHSIFTKGAEGTKYQESYIYISSETLSVKSSAGGLGSDIYPMKGTAGLDIRNVYVEERRYIINAFNSNKVKTVYDLSNLIPTSNESTEGEDNIYDVIPSSISSDYDSGDFTYTIVYSVIDKAGNESTYIARGVIFASLIPVIKVNNENVEEIEPNVYQLNVSQGADLNEFIETLGVKASTGLYDKTSYLSQTVYYNGELIEENRKYKENIHETFSLNNPGVYEIIYSLSYEYTKNGQSEIIEAEPIKLIINIEATEPTVKNNNRYDFTNLILILTVMLGAIFICYIGVANKRRN